MAPIPVWTKKEWRPLATELCAHFRKKRAEIRRRDGGGGDCGGATVEADATMEEESEDEGDGIDDGIDDVDGGEELLLRADRVVGKLYMNGFMDCTPQQVDKQARALATKFRVHSLDERADKLLELASRCDYQVLKMLMELAVRPTAASDEAITVDYAREGVGSWVDEARGGQDAKEAKEEALRDQLIDELVQISTNDEWYQEWEDTSDEDDDMMEDSDTGNSQRPAWPVETSFAQFRRPKRPSTALEEGDAAYHEGNKTDELFKTTLDALVCDTETSSMRDAVVQYDQLSEEELHDHLVRRNFPLVDSSGDCSLNCALYGAAPGTAVMIVDLEGADIPFTMDRPWLLCHAVVADAKKQNAALPVELVHEQTCVNLAFRALEGVESDMFELRTRSQALRLFHVEFHPSEFCPSTPAQGIAVSHLSPTALRNILGDFARVASDLQLLRDIQARLRATSSGLPASVTIDGLASALSEVLWLVDTTILSVEQECHHPNEGDSPDDCSSLAVSWFERNASRTQLTLLGVHGRLKQLFRMVSWLSRTLPSCLGNSSSRETTREVRPGECATAVLSTLYRLLEEEFIEQADAGLFGDLWASDDGLQTWKWTRYDVLLHLFVGALRPYLDLMQQLLFERRGYTPSDSIELPSELFFVSAAPVLLANPDDQSFKAGLSQLAPFGVDVELVPVFLRSLAGLMKDALASRQMMNRFLSTEQHTGAKLDLMSPVKASLQELFTHAVERAGWRGLGDIVVGSEDDQKCPPWQPRPLQVTPVTQLLEECLITHLKQKVRSHAWPFTWLVC